MVHELRYVLRSLARRKGFALVTVLTLALGIGAATAIYSVAAWHLFRGPPAPPDVFLLGVRTPDGNDQMYIPAAYAEAYAADKDVIAGAAYVNAVSTNVVVDRDPVSTWVLAVSAPFFDVLGLTPAEGRPFAPSECVQGRDNVVLVSYGFWKAHLGGLPSALGARIRVGGDICTVVGVLRKDQRLPVMISGDVFRPLFLKIDPSKTFEKWLLAFVRLRQGVGPRQAEAALGAIKPGAPSAVQDNAETLKPAVSTVAHAETFLHRELYWTLLGAVGFLYAIACLNSTSLALVHLFGRRRELSVRAALGGSRWEILRLVWLESAVLTLGGSLLAALTANEMGALFSLGGEGQPDPHLGWFAWNLGGHAYWVLGGLSLVTSFLTSAAPVAFLLRTNLNDGLKSGGGSVGESPTLARTRGVCVVLQAAFAVILLVGAGLMIRTFQRLEHLRLGFEPAHRVKLEVGAFADTAPSTDQQNARLLGLKGALLRVPGVSSVAYSSGSLLSGYYAMWTMLKARDASEIKVAMVSASDDYLTAGGIRLLSGRWFAQDSKTDVVINETLSRRWFAGANPIGQYIQNDRTDATKKGWQVVGVAGDVREEVHERPLPTVYVSARWSTNVVSTYFVDLNVRPEAKELQALREAVYSIDPNIVIGSIRPLETMLGDQTYNERLTLSVLRVLSTVALTLTLVGLFSVVAYTVDRRMGEFGIRMAIGATPGALVLLVLRRSFALTLFGVFLGVMGAMALTRFIRSLLYESPSFDGWVVGSVALLLILSGTAACLHPARKAAKPDLTTLLRQAD